MKSFIAIALTATLAFGLKLKQEDWEDWEDFSDPVWDTVEAAVAEFDESGDGNMQREEHEALADWGAETGLWSWEDAQGMKDSFDDLDAVWEWNDGYDTWDAVTALESEYSRDELEGMMEGVRHHLEQRRLNRPEDWRKRVERVHSSMDTNGDWNVDKDEHDAFADWGLESGLWGESEAQDIKDSFGHFDDQWEWNDGYDSIDFVWGFEDLLANGDLTEEELHEALRGIEDEAIAQFGDHAIG